MQKTNIFHCRTNKINNMNQKNSSYPSKNFPEERVKTFAFSFYKFGYQIHIRSIFSHENVSLKTS